jgi:hypothetical protein
MVLTGTIIRQPDPFIEWTGSLMAIIEKLLKTVDYKIGSLKV